MVRVAALVASVSVVLGLLCLPPVAAQSDVLERSFPAGGRVVLDLTAGDYDIVGTLCRSGKGGAVA